MAVYTKTGRAAWGTLAAGLIFTKEASATTDLDATGARLVSSGLTGSVYTKTGMGVWGIWVPAIVVTPAATGPDRQFVQIHPWRTLHREHEKTGTVFLAMTLQADLVLTVDADAVELEFIEDAYAALSFLAPV